jgi:hypothetical protein
MSSLILLVSALLAQDEALAGRLKRDGWKAVEELGTQPKLKPELQKLAEDGSDDLKWWAGATLAEIDARDKGADYVGSRRVTLEARERKAHEILSELLAPDRLQLTGDLKPAEKPVSVTFRDTPVFQALDDVCREAGCALRRKTDGMIEVRPAGGVTERPNTYAGPMSVAVTEFTLKSTADFRSEPQALLRIGITIRMDPRFWLLRRNCTWSFVSALDDTGAALAVTDPGGWGGSGVDQPFAYSMHPGVAPPGKKAKKIAVLRGIATVRICRSPQELVFTDLLTAPDQVREAGGIKITLRKVAFQDGEYEALLDYEPKDAPAAPALDDLLLEDAKGFRFPHGSGSSGNGSVFGIFRPTVPGKEPVRLRVDVPVGVHERKIYFELRDIPLP